MSSILFSLPEIYASYRKWVGKNPQTAADCETTAKWVSYFIAGRINNSQVVSELVYALSNLLVLFNDRIISNARQIDFPNYADRLKLWLTILEYSEVFIELSANKLWGLTGKWLIIFSVQVFKCISRLILIYQHKESIIQHPPIPVLQRKNIINVEEQSYRDATISDVAQAQLDTVCFTLKRSGKVIRKVDSSPPIGLRNWKPIDTTASDNQQTIEQALVGRQLIAETLYIIKPIVHLSSIACCGNNTWKPWIISLIFDLTSLHLYHSCKQGNLQNFSRTQKLQMSRRTVSLILYLLRSPVYEKYSEDRIQRILRALSKSVPLAGIISNPLAQYLPFWQSCYFYMWST